MYLDLLSKETLEVTREEKRFVAKTFVTTRETAQITLPLFIDIDAKCRHRKCYYHTIDI